ADPTSGGADPLAAQPALGELVQLFVPGHDQVRVGRDEQLAGGDALGVEGGQLGQQGPRVDHHAVADYRGDVRVEDAARDQVELEGAAADVHRVPGVVAALVADDHVHLVSQQVGGLALALVTPLAADEDGSRHVPG